MSKAPQPDARATRADLVAQLRRLQGEIQRVQARLMALGGDTLPGIHLVIEAAGRRALLPAGRVVEIVRMVATTPLAGAPPNVIGTFICRGTPVLAYDLSRLLGSKEEPGLDSQIVVLAGTPTVGLVVDRVPRLVEDPRIYEGDVVAGLPEAWRDSRLASGLCMDGEEVLPVLDPSPIQAELSGKDA